MIFLCKHKKNHGPLFGKQRTISVQFTATLAGLSLVGGEGAGAGMVQIALHSIVPSATDGSQVYDPVFNLLVPSETSPHGTDPLLTGSFDMCENELALTYLAGGGVMDVATYTISASSSSVPGGENTALTGSLWLNYANNVTTVGLHISSATPSTGMPISVGTPYTLSVNGMRL